MNKIAIIKEFFQFLKERRNWTVGIVAFLLLLLASLIVLSQGSAVAPFIYTIF